MSQHARAVCPVCLSVCLSLSLSSLSLSSLSLLSLSLSLSLAAAAAAAFISFLELVKQITAGMSDRLLILLQCSYADLNQ